MDPLIGNIHTVCSISLTTYSILRAVKTLSLYTGSTSSLSWMTSVVLAYVTLCVGHSKAFAGLPCYQGISKGWLSLSLDQTFDIYPLIYGLLQ